MKLYAAWRGEWNDYREAYRWHWLEAAAGQCGLHLNDGKHGALPRVGGTLAILRYLATEDPSRYRPLSRFD